MEKQKLKALVVIFWLAALCAVCFLSCQTSHVERFHGDKDSVNYYRNGSVEWSWRNR